MPHQMPLRSGDPRRIGRYRVTGRLEGIPTEDPMFTAAAPDGAEVALSLLRGDWARDGAARDRFAAEAAVAKRVPPFCAARVLDAGLDGTDAYLVSEYVQGRSLLDVVSADGGRRGQALEAIAIGMATGLASVHQVGLVHGNFGPEYVITRGDGRVQVIEYGITPPYGTATPSADMFAWAQTVVFAALGRPPATAADLAVLEDHIRVPVERCLDTNPAQRLNARGVVATLLGDGELPGGLLAEGARRAIIGREHGQAGEFADDASAAAGPWAPAPWAPEPRAREALADRARGPAGGPPGPRPRQGPPAGRGRGGGGPGNSGPGNSGPPGTRRPPASGPSRPAREELGAGRRPARGGPSRAGEFRPAGREPAKPDLPPREPAAERTRLTGQRIAWLGGGLVAVILVVVVLLHLATGGSPRPAAGPSDTLATRTPSTSPSSSAEPLATGPDAPAAFVGSWTGQVVQTSGNLSTTLAVSIVLRSGANTGMVTYTGPGITLSCTVAITNATSGALGMNQFPGQQDSCAGGQVQMKLTGTGAASFTFSGNGETASGSVARS